MIKQSVLYMQLEEVDVDMVEKNKAIAIITARGGSKRIPKKNIKNFCGRPIIAYSIEAALQSGVFHEVIVSTDSQEIADMAIKYGASVPFMRSEMTSNDYATSDEAVEEVLNNYKEMGKDYDYGCCIYPTAPFVTAQKLRDAYDLLLEKQADTVLPVVSFSFPPQRSFIIHDGLAQYHFPEYRNARSQDLIKEYHDAGQFYYFRITSFMKNKDTIGTKVVPIIMSELEVQDIDNEVDWQLAEMKYKLFKNQK